MHCSPKDWLLSQIPCDYAEKKKKTHLSRCHRLISLIKLDLSLNTHKHSIKHTHRHTCKRGRAKTATMSNIPGTSVKKSKHRPRGLIPFGSVIDLRLGLSASLSLSVIRLVRTLYRFSPKNWQGRVSMSSIRLFLSHFEHLSQSESLRPVLFWKRPTRSLRSLSNHHRDPLSKRQTCFYKCVFIYISFKINLIKCHKNEKNFEEHGVPSF